jgi:hypothetical protein
MKFKKSCSKILERQDQSLISVLTRLTSLEIRVDSLEFDGIKTKTIDTGLGKRTTTQNVSYFLRFEKLTIITAGANFRVIADSWETDRWFQKDEERSVR